MAPNPLSGKPLRYLIGAEDQPAGVDGEVTEVAYDQGLPAHGIGIGYCNLFVEDGEIEGYGPYLNKAGTTAEDYDEGLPDPGGPGFRRNIIEQLDRRKAGGFSIVEQDNPDTFAELGHVDAVMTALGWAQERGLSVVAKNPGLIESTDNQKLYVSHPCIVGIIVENGDGDPASMHDLRVRCGKPDIPVWFVAFDDDEGGEDWARETAKAARAYKNMGVTFSRDGEYTSVEDFLKPAAASSVQPSPVSMTDTFAGKIIAAMERRGAVINRNPGEVNIVYCEGMNADGTANANRPNAFDDLRCVVRFLGPVPIYDGQQFTTGSTPKIVGAWEATSETGRTYTLDPINDKGAAIIALGQQRAWQVGIHHEGKASAHEALIQTGGQVTVYRDAHKSFKREGNVTDRGWFGINQHWGYDQPRDDIGPASAGCLVGRLKDGHREFMALVKSDPRYIADRKFIFSTTVLSAAEILSGSVGAELPPPDILSRPLLSLGSTGPDVIDLQTRLGVDIDGKFGPKTEAAVLAYQEAHGLRIDGIVGPETWGALLGVPGPSQSPVQGGSGAALPADLIAKITVLAGASALARYSWVERGRAPVGYIKGMAVCFAKVYLDLKSGSSAARVMAGAIGDPDRDALAWYGFTIDEGVIGSATETLRSLFALLIGLGMLESSGKYWEGLDTKAGFKSADETEAGLFQQSWNSRAASPELPKLFTSWSMVSSDGLLSIFREGVPPGSSSNLGGGQGEQFQALCKAKPAFAVECAAIALRVLGGREGHFGPIRTRKAERRPEADALLKQVQALVDGIVVQPQPPIIVPDPEPEPTDIIVPREDAELAAIMRECLSAIEANLRPILEKHMAPVPATRDPNLDEILDLLRNIRGAAAAAPAPPPVTSSIDKVLGGQNLVGFKTLTGAIGLIATIFGAPAAGIELSGGMFNTLTGLFTLLTSAGFISKIDRGLKFASDVRDALKKLSAMQDQSRPVA